MRPKTTDSVAKLPPPLPVSDTRLRPFRAAAYVCYLVVVSAFSLCIIVSVVRSVLAMTPDVPAAAQTVLSIPECAGQAAALWNSLEVERQNLGRSSVALNADAGWTQFRVGWLASLRSVEARCGNRSPERADLTRVFKRLEHVEDLYTTAAVQYAGEIGPSVDALRKGLTALGARP